MKLPPPASLNIEWSTQVLNSWITLQARSEKLAKSSGSNDAFLGMLAIFRSMVSSGNFSGLSDLLKRRLAARALTYLWLNDESMASRLFNEKILNTLVASQSPRLTRLTFLQLLQFYFRYFDQLGHKQKSENDVRQVLEEHLHAQLELIPFPKVKSTRPDILVTLKRSGSWLLKQNGPKQISDLVREQGKELAAYFSEMGLGGYDNGRYGDICRAHFYLDTLREIPFGQSHEVMDELLKPSVNKAPYAGDKRIGHAALEILIDRCGEEPGDIWQNFILELAGDPRIAKSAPHYREWWAHLGEERVQKVRGWLSKEDLRLFLQAVEQYGIESKNSELVRMFPARKRFLEGLFKLNLIRSTRLLLGQKARQSVKRILGQDVKTSFAIMDGSMSDKAVIYLDCGDFHLIEGSHSFKIFVYLALPDEALRSYEQNSFSHYDLTQKVPATYKRLNSRLPYGDFVHTPHVWQNKIFNFLAQNGIELDIEQLLSPDDYRLQLQRYGIPTVTPKKLSSFKVRADVTPSVTLQVEKSDSEGRQRQQTHSVSSSSSRIDTKEDAKQFARETLRAPSSAVYLSSQFGKKTVHNDYVSEKKSDYTKVSSLLSADVYKQIERLKPIEIKVLRYFSDNPGDSVRYAANVLGVRPIEVTVILNESLKNLCVKDGKFGWRLTTLACGALEDFDQKERGDD